MTRRTAVSRRPPRCGEIAADVVGIEQLGVVLRGVADDAPRVGGRPLGEGVVRDAVDDLEWDAVGVGDIVGLVAQWGSLIGDGSIMIKLSKGVGEAARQHFGECSTSASGHKETLGELVSDVRF